MAHVEGNVITTGLRGKVGNLVFRKRGKKTTVYMLAERKAPRSENEKNAQARFARAVARAKSAINIAAERKRFEEMAKATGRESAYSAAIAYFMKQKE